MSYHTTPQKIRYTFAKQDKFDVTFYQELHQINDKRYKIKVVTPKGEAYFTEKFEISSGLITFQNHFLTLDGMMFPIGSEKTDARAKCTVTLTDFPLLWLPHVRWAIKLNSDIANLHEAYCDFSLQKWFQFPPYDTNPVDWCWGGVNQLAVVTKAPEDKPGARLSSVILEFGIILHSSILITDLQAEIIITIINPHIFD